MGPGFPFLKTPSQPPNWNAYKSRATFAAASSGLLTLSSFAAKLAELLAYF